MNKNNTQIFLQKEMEKRLNDLETRLMQRFNNLTKMLDKRREIEDVKLHKKIDTDLASYFQIILEKVNTLAKKVERQKF